jgi:hypothetical protein
MHNNHRRAYTLSDFAPLAATRYLLVSIKIDHVPARQVLHFEQRRALARETPILLSIVLDLRLGLEFGALGRSDDLIVIVHRSVAGFLLVFGALLRSGLGGGWLVGCGGGGGGRGGRVVAGFLADLLEMLARGM